MRSSRSSSISFGQLAQPCAAHRPAVGGPARTLALGKAAAASRSAPTAARQLRSCSSARRQLVRRRDSAMPMVTSPGRGHRRRRPARPPWRPLGLLATGPSRAGSGTPRPGLSCSARRPCGAGRRFPRGPCRGAPRSAARLRPPPLPPLEADWFELARILSLETRRPATPDARAAANEVEGGRGGAKVRLSWVLEPRPAARFPTGLPETALTQEPKNRAPQAWLRANTTRRLTLSTLPATASRLVRFAGAQSCQSKKETSSEEMLARDPSLTSGSPGRD